MLCRSQVSTCSCDGERSGAVGLKPPPLPVTGQGWHWLAVGGRIWPGLCEDQDVFMFPASGNDVLSYYFMHRGMETFCFYVFPSLLFPFYAPDTTNCMELMTGRLSKCGKNFLPFCLFSFPSPC